ncbi:Gfo/Idh/MocA family protein [Kitasatospora sp. P5_F3]
MTSSDRPIRWGVLATGGIAAAFTADLLAVPGAEVAAVASRTEPSARAFADRFGIPRAYGSWAELAADPGIDVVYVATPHSAHQAATTLMLESGKAVLCEKPFTLNVRQAEQLVAAARAHGRFLMEAMWMYFNPVVRQVVELVRDGAIGEVRAVHADFGFPTPPDPTSRLRDPAAGGGALLDLGVYPVSFAHLLLGEPEQVRAVATLTPEGVDEHTGIVLGHTGGALSLLSCSLVAGYSQRASVHGSTGRIELPADFFHATDFVLHQDGKPAQKFTLDRGPGNGLGLEAAEVVRCLRAGLTESPLVPLDGTLAVMRTLDAVRAQVGVRYPEE